jgi:hypothetical protein
LGLPVSSFPECAHAPGSGPGAARVACLPRDTKPHPNHTQTHAPLQDVYDKRRQALIKQLKADSLTWVSKYARGGSVRAQSARNM